MDEQLPPDALHPNIARIAAAYDRIIEQMSLGQLTPTQARAHIDQLEARDDQGVRWSIDPDSGQFVRKTLLGDTEFDTPPVYGYATDDAYSYSSTRGSAEDPNMRLELFTASGDDRLTKAPTDLAGATRNGPTRPASPLQTWWVGLPRTHRLGGAMLLVVVLLLLILT